MSNYFRDSSTENFERFRIQLDKPYLRTILHTEKFTAIRLHLYINSEAILLVSTNVHSHVQETPILCVPKHIYNVSTQRCQL